jgi:hypothetical protein
MKTTGIIFAVLLLTCALVGNGFAQSTVTMNEIYSRGVAGNLDWIEVYNSAATQLDISGYMIYDVGGQTGPKPKKVFPAGTILPAKGFYVIVTDTATSATIADGFGLSSTGETVWLENATGTIIDSIAFPALGNDTSYARKPDGWKNWARVTPVTRGLTNGPGDITMNEIYTRGVVGNLDWIEVYNSTATQIDISGYKIYDVGGQTGPKPKKLFPAGTILPAKGFYVIVTDTATSATIADGFGLSSTGETVWLENVTGTIIDSVAIPALGNDTSYARKPDGSMTWLKSTPPTRGLTNGTGTAVREEGTLVTRFALDQNFPNPFNPSTTITYAVPTSSHVSLKVYGILGTEVASLVNETQTAGRYTVRFIAGGLSTGVYFYRLTAGSFVETKKLTLLK